MSATAPPRATDGATRAADVPADPSAASTGELIGQLGEQVSRLVHDEVRLAQAEVTQKAKRLGIGAGLLGGAGLVAVLGFGALVTAAILGLANVLPGWPAAVLVALVLFAVAAVLALIGEKDADKGTPLPTETIASVQDDIDTVTKAVSR